MAKRLLLFGIADPRPLLSFSGFRLFLQECEEIASSLVFSRGWLLTLVYVFLCVPCKREKYLELVKEVCR